MFASITHSEREPYLIVGLGNPGKEYAQSRHNIGFMVLDRLVERYGFAFTRYEQKAFVVKVVAEQGTLIFAKPQTFMNLSGQSVAPLVRFYKVPLEQLMIVYDDIDLPFGTLRMRPGGSSGGHKGMQSILDRLGRQDIPRLRVGIGRPSGSRAAANYVLNEFNAREKLDLPFVLDRAAQAVQDWINLGLVEAMNRHNVNLFASET
ncbi:MAG: aminoacyl-tRNA hydrolase [Anaerolineales bacterium]|nr:aminoacyl-tRNA hydrolase [Anaerolineales bacterium]